MRSLGKKQGGARVSEELGTGGEEKEEAEEPWESGSDRRVMEGRWELVERKKNRRLRKSNSKFKWHLSWPRIQGIFTNVVLLNQSKGSIIPIHLGKPI